MGTPTADRSYVGGALAPVDTEITAVDLRVTGTVPAELCGRYVRNGPNPINPDATTQHWFTGAGMVHGVRLEEGRAAWYRNQWVRSTNASNDLGEPAAPGPRHGMEAGGSVNTDELETITSNNFDGTLDERAQVQRETVIPVDGRPMVHDTAITATRVLLFDLPCQFNLEVIAAGGPFPYVWDTNREARVGVLPLNPGTLDPRPPDRH